jgi:hypothetical protein
LRPRASGHSDIALVTLLSRIALGAWIPLGARFSFGTVPRVLAGRARAREQTNDRCWEQDSHWVFRKRVEWVGVFERRTLWAQELVGRVCVTDKGGAGGQPAPSKRPSTRSGAAPHLQFRWSGSAGFERTKPNSCTGSACGLRLKTFSQYGFWPTMFPAGR